MITNLSLYDFRNYTEKSFEFSEKNVVFFGENGRGKTNILEALALFSVGKSWREQTGADLIRIGSESALLKAKTDTNDFYRIIIQNRSRSFEKNEKKIPLQKHFGQIASLLFVPEYINLFSGTKQNRQRFFDRFLFQVSTPFRDLLSKYNKALKQKNALLKTFEGDILSENNIRNQIQPWNILFSELIPQIINLRKDFLIKINPILEKEFQNISQSKDPLSIELTQKEEYDPSPEGVLVFLKENFKRELYSKRCIIGAHRDDFNFVLRERPLRATASRGEERSVLLSFLSAQKDLMKTLINKNPILLLDDVFSELDQSRQDYLEHLCSESQIFFTTTHENHFKNFSFPIQKIKI